MSDTFTLTLYGTRGSRTIAGERFARFGGDTTCVGLQIGQRRLIFDAGSGIVKLGQDAAAAHRASGDPGPLKTWLFLTHAHYDHLCGLPYFGPLYAPNAITWLYGPRNPFLSFQETIERFVHPPYHPVPMYEMQGEVRWGEVSEPEALYFLKGQDDPVAVRRCRPHIPAPDPDQVELVVSCMRGYNHPKSGVMIYKIQSQGRTVVLATDTEAYVLDDQRLIRFAQGADVLLHDGMYTEETYTSSPSPPRAGATPPSSPPSPSPAPPPSSASTSSTTTPPMTMTPCRPSRPAPPPSSPPRAAAATASPSTCSNHTTPDEAPAHHL